MVFHWLPIQKDSLCGNLVNWSGNRFIFQARHCEKRTDESSGMSRLWMISFAECPGLMWNLGSLTTSRMFSWMGRLSASINFLLDLIICLVLLLSFLLFFSCQTCIRFLKRRVTLKDTLTLCRLLFRMHLKLNRTLFCIVICRSLSEVTLYPTGGVADQLVAL